MDLLLILSQEHDKLPLAELRAVLEIEEIETEMEIVCPGLVILRNLDEDVFDDYYRIFVRRLGYTHEVHQLIDECEYEDLDSAVKAIDWSEYVDENFAINYPVYTNVQITHEVLHGLSRTIDGNPQIFGHISTGHERSIYVGIDEGVTQLFTEDIEQF